MGVVKDLLSDKVGENLDDSGPEKGWTVHEIMWAMLYACHSATTRHCQGRFMLSISLFQEIHHVGGDPKNRYSTFGGFVAVDPIPDNFESYHHIAFEG